MITTKDIMQMSYGYLNIIVVMRDTFDQIKIITIVGAKGTGILLKDGTLVQFNMESVVRVIRVYNDLLFI